MLNFWLKQIKKDKKLDFSWNLSNFFFQITEIFILIEVRFDFAERYANFRVLFANFCEKHIKKDKKTIFIENLSFFPHNIKNL